MSISVLIVDDDPITIQLLKLILERNGYQVLAARSAAAALDLLEEQRPHIILVDDMMPHMTGGDLCRTIKSDPKLRDICVILMSAGIRVESASYIQQIGADYALPKPIISRDVLDALENVLTR
jgi:CheY-like chemotaxis protein